jgi:hypothetical protein
MRRSIAAMASPELEAGGRLALNEDRGEAAEAVELGGAVGPAAGGERRERDHGAGPVAHVPAVDVLGLHAKRGVALQVDALGAAAVDEVVDVAAAPGGGEGRVDVGECEAEGGGLLAVDVDLVLRACPRGRPGGRFVSEGSGGEAEQLIAGGDEGLVAEAAAVLELELEAGGVAELADRGRDDGEDRGLLDLRERGHGPAGDRGGAQVGVAPRSSQGAGG